MKTSPSLVNSNQDSSTRRREAGAPTCGAHGPEKRRELGVLGNRAHGGRTPLLQRVEAETQFGEEVEIVCGGPYGNVVD